VRISNGASSWSGRGWGLSIAVWLVSGIALVIGAFVTGSLLATRGANLATHELARVQTEIEPLTRAAREVSESSAGFDRAVLEFLGTDSAENHASVVAAGERLALAINKRRDRSPR
jgi:hypothetical protein